MIKLSLLYYLGALLLTLSVWGQENAIRKLSPSLLECYENNFLSQRNNTLPHTLNTFVSILRKIENTEGLNMDLRSLSVALLHRFRQDGIVLKHGIPEQDGVTPYAPSDPQFYRLAQTLKLIPGDARQFPNNSITNVERCTLHFMLSSSIEKYQRGNEAKVCRYASQYRYPRSVSDHDGVTSKHTNDAKTDNSNTADAETLSPDQLKTMSNPRDERTKVTDDPNKFYSEKQEKNPKMQLPPLSKCPVENGVIQTRWGVISPGLVLSAIAAATQPQQVMLGNLQSDLSKKYNADLLSVPIDNKWFATLAGDLAEVALIQGPTRANVGVGTTGHWNSIALPRWYFLDSNETYEMTTAEIRGDLDGLILANEVSKLYSRIPKLRLSQVFDMYYSEKGFFDPSIRACNRRTLFTTVATNKTMTEQTISAALLLNSDIAEATVNEEKIQEFSVKAVNNLITYVPSSMNMDLTCEKTDSLNDFLQAKVDLTIILDTTWAFSAIQPILATLLEGIDLNQFNSNFTLINGYDGTEIINSTSSILDFYAYNSSHYDNITHKFDLAKSIDKVQERLEKKLENERNRGEGGARSDIVLIIPYSFSITSGDKEYSLGRISRMREQIPDTTSLIMAYGSKDMWSELVQNPVTDLFTIGTGDTEEDLLPITNLISRIKQGERISAIVPKRLINTQCGSNFISTGQSNAYVDYVPPNTVNLYRLHPNYFFKPGSSATVKIQGSNLDNLTICSAREPLYPNAKQNVMSKTCVSVTGETYNITVSCAEATFIHDCPPLYLSVIANSTSTACTDLRIE
ncbi:uncharacterized protein LOC143214566 [Lasioglossum baleicum]|uniref:uncharacterized protein LOC143214566 n=1 Tax=Lasioglossum baleicum TaxID=434251 RepID=UPI003FCDBC21